MSSCSHINNNCLLTEIISISTTFGLECESLGGKSKFQSLEEAGRGPWA